jgi:hypothetical protein
MCFAVTPLYALESIRYSRAGNGLSDSEKRARFTSPPSGQVRGRRCIVGVLGRRHTDPLAVARSGAGPSSADPRCQRPLAGNAGLSAFCVTCIRRIADVSGMSSPSRADIAAVADSLPCHSGNRTSPRGGRQSFPGRSPGVRPSSGGSFTGRHPPGVIHGRTIGLFTHDASYSM